MQDEQELNSEERILMESLSGLMPEAPGVSEQTLWYEAGVRAGRRRAARWRAVAAAVIVLAGGVVMWRPKAATIYVRQEVPDQLVEGSSAEGDRRGRPVASMEYVVLRDAVERRGMEALPREGGAGVLSQPTQGAGPAGSMLSVPSPWDSIGAKGSL